MGSTASLLLGLLALQVLVLFPRLTETQNTGMTPTMAAQLVTVAPWTPPPEKEDVLNRPIDKAMWGVYQMTKYFLESIIYPPSLNELAKQVNLTSFDTAIESLQTDWQSWARHYIKYLVCAAFGILFALALPIIGCCVCCCRCRGKCGASGHPMDSKYAKVERVACGFLLGAVSTLLLLGVVCTFLANELMREQTEKTGATETVSENLGNIESFKNILINDVKRVVQQDFREAKDAIVLKLNKSPNEAKDRLATFSGAGPALDNFIAFSIGLTTLKADLLNMQNISDYIVKEQTKLQGNISQIKDDIPTELKECKNSTNNSIIFLCNETLAQVGSLRQIANYSTVGSVSNAIDAIDMITGRTINIAAVAIKAKATFDNISEIVKIETSAGIQQAIEKLDEVEDGVNDFLNASLADLEHITFEKIRQGINTTVSPAVEYYGNIRFYICIFLNCLVLFVVFCYYLGLVYGACGSRAGQRAECCNRGRGSTVLMAGVASVFVFCFFLMIVTTILFIPGGIMHTEICRHWLYPAKSDAVQLWDTMLANSLGLQNNISFMSTLTNCEQDQAIYTAANIENTFPELNITHILDLNRYGIREILESAMNVAIKIGNISMVNSNTTLAMQQLDQVLQAVDLDSYTRVIRQNFTNIDLASFSSFLFLAAGTINQTNENLAKAFLLSAKKVQNIQNFIVIPLEETKTQLQLSVSSTQEHLTKYNATKVIVDLQDAEQRVNTYGNDMLKNVTVTLAREIYDELVILFDDIQKKVRNDVGRCRSAYSSVTDSLTAVCIQFLYPFNGFWYSHGGCLFLFIPSIFLAIRLAKLYRKTERYSELEQLRLELPRTRSRSRSRSRSYSNSYPEVRSSNEERPINMTNIGSNHKRSSPGATNHAYEEDDGGFGEHGRHQNRNRQLPTVSAQIDPKYLQIYQAGPLPGQPTGEINEGYFV